jgi:hypothetical protein
VGEAEVERGGSGSVAIVEPSEDGVFALLEKLNGQTHVLVPLVGLLRQPNHGLAALLINLPDVHAFVVHIFLLLKLEESHPL